MLFKIMQHQNHVPILTTFYHQHLLLRLSHERNLVPCILKNMQVWLYTNIHFSHMQLLYGINYHAGTIKEVQSLDTFNKNKVYHTDGRLHDTVGVLISYHSKV